MSTVDPYALEAKARLYVGRGLEHSRESSQFAFWFHLAIEPLARGRLRRSTLFCWPTARREIRRLARPRRSAWTSPSRSVPPGFSTC